MSDDESQALMTNIPFRGRIKVESLKYADSIFLEPTSTPAHNTRLRWANDTFRAPDVAANLIQPSVTMDPAVQAAGIDTDGDSLITDALLGGAVQAAVNKLL